MQPIPLIGFAPDMAPTTPGAMTACNYIVPTPNGFRVAYDALAASGISTLPLTPDGAVTLRGVDGNDARTLATTTACDIYRLDNAGTWSAVRNATLGTGFAAGAMFCRFGDTTIGAVYATTSPLQFAVLPAVSGGVFADIAGAPNAPIVFTVGDFVMALGANDNVLLVTGDRWWCCGIFDYTTWAPSVSTQANHGRLLEGREFTAGLALGRQAVAYKRRAMWVGNYVGGTAVWQWERVPGDNGCVGRFAVCDIGGSHAFLSDGDVLIFDGTRVRSIAEGKVKDWLRQQTPPSTSRLVHEASTGLLWVLIGGGGTALVCHLATGRWSKTTTGGMGGPHFLWCRGAAYQEGIAFFSGTTLSIYTGTPTNPGTFTTWHVGDQWHASRVSRARLRFGSAFSATTSTCSGVTFESAANDAVAAGSATAMSDGKFDIRQRGRWHQFTFNVAGITDFDAVSFDIKAAGKR